MRGKVCLVTGATSGIGLVTARELARQGARVILVGRNREKTDAALQQIRAATGNPEVEALLADLSSQQQVRDLARQFAERSPRLDVLVNNAGGLWLERRLTADGIELTFALNHLAYFLLTQLLLDPLKAGAPARIVNVSSRAHRSATLDFDNLQGERGYRGWQQYCRSKLMNLLFTYELDRRLRGAGITVNALHPGWVYTGFGGSNGWRGAGLQLLARFFAIGPEEGARTMIYLATAPAVAAVSGHYFVEEKAVPSSAASYDLEAARRLWEVSERMTHLTAAV
jgi:NAD(P)-dependent dehydrogenase (short-subunit alcohol dehydrogenase family)